MVLKKRALLLLGSIALFSTPAAARTSAALSEASNDRTEFKDFSASRRSTKARQAKQRDVNGRFVPVRNAKAQPAKRPQAKPQVVRNVRPKAQPVTQYREIGQLEFQTTYKPTVQKPTRQQATRQQPARQQSARNQSGLDSYASLPDRHSIAYMYQTSDMYQMSAYQAVMPNRSTPAPRHRRDARQAYRMQDRTPDRTAEEPHNWGGGAVVAEARRYLGTNPTKYSRLWCAHFMNMVLERTGRRGTGSGFAKSFASYGTRVSGPQVGAIAVMYRKGGGHVGVVSGVDAKGNPIIISGNHNKRVAEAVYPRGRVYAYVMP